MKILEIHKKSGLDKNGKAPIMGRITVNRTMAQFSEIPHGIAVVVERFKERPGTDLIDIDVNIYCERESHKGMVIGKGGAMLKKIASAARADCEEFLGCRVNLQCWVKVKSDWRDNEFLLNNFGFKQNSSNR